MVDQGDISLFEIRWAQHSMSYPIFNNTDYVFILGDSNSSTANVVKDAWAAHGCVIATSMYCFPGQAFELGGFSKGAGVGVYFRIQVWKIPRNEPDPKLNKELVEVHSSLKAYLIDRNPDAHPVHVANLYVFLDVPGAGQNIIDVLETGPDVNKSLSDNGDDLTGDYENLPEFTHTSSGEKLKVVYHINKCENPSGEIEVSVK
ncbi:hypothetical protein M501DRAFT_134129 [Patellaria atrata CBS 101060]|uniref:Uncharacterized protein n=1 Tax=Patellaria atrata CBS 101060 TaxID=1346257 RepID=A0A9P4VPV3_9PEZI|nr:hypothetical protein M501DRAFT_134129 [Patellaria atrata CBS 101060]